MTTSAAQHAIGALKLAGPTEASAWTIWAASTLAACNEAIATDLMSRLYCSLFAVLRCGYLPHVTLTTDPAAPFACVITDGAGNVVDRQAGKTIEGITETIRLRHSAGCGEAG